MNRRSLLPGRGPLIELGVGLAVMTLLASLVAVVRVRDLEEPRVEPGRPHILLFSIDTLRADHLGSYGWKRNTSPVLDALARRSLRFREALAPAPYTLPSHVSMFTGRHPHEIGIQTRESRIPDDVRLVTELLSQAGYRSAAFVDSVPRDFVGAERGFARGFDEFHHLPAEARLGYRYDMKVTADAAIDWLRDRDASQPFFLFLHTKSVHALPPSATTRNPKRYPYYKPARYLARFVSRDAAELAWDDPELGDGVTYLRRLNERLATGELSPAQIPPERIEALEMLYDAGIYYVDEHFGRILRALDQLGLAGATAIVVTSDHGEAFLEHRLLLHKEVYRSVLHVPLIVHQPWSAEPGAPASPVTLMDIAPTLLDLAGLPPAPDLSGRSLLAIAREEAGGTAETPPARFAYYRSRQRYYYEAWALREGPWALIHHRLGYDDRFVTELYDRRHDPHEQHPVADPPRERAMLGRLQRWREQGFERPAEEIELDAETLEHLRALGYAE